MDRKAHRRARLQKLIDTKFGGTQAKLARAIKRSDAQINQWLSGYRAIGDGGAHLIETKLGLPQGWMDQDHQSSVAPVLSMPASVDALISAIAALPQSVRKALAEDLAVLAVAPDSAQAKARVLAALCAPQPSIAEKLLDIPSTAESPRLPRAVKQP
jgi:plasmid maintenance system antidote protein VapI